MQDFNAYTEMHFEYFCIKNILNPSSSAHQMGQSIQERTKWNLWETAFKKFHEVHCWILCPKCAFILVFEILNMSTLKGF